MRIRYLPSDGGKIQKTATIYERYEHGVSGKAVSTEARKVITRLKRFGYPTYVVGGAVRDLIIGKRPKDIDIATAAPLKTVRSLFRNSMVIGKRFPLVHIIFHTGIIEVTSFSQKNSAEEIWVSMQGDAKRRDFSINALYFCPDEEIIIDYVNGFKDFKRKLLRPIIPVTLIFKEDPVRIIRAIKYAALTSFSIPAVYRRRLISSANLLINVPGERIAVEVEKILRSGYSVSIMKSVLDYGAYPYISSEMSEMLLMYDGLKEKWFDYLAQIDELIAKKPDVSLDRLLALYFAEFAHVLIADGQLEHHNTVIAAQMRGLVHPTNFSIKCIRDATRHLVKGTHKFFPNRYKNSS